MAGPTHSKEVEFMSHKHQQSARSAQRQAQRCGALPAQQIDFPPIKPAKPAPFEPRTDKQRAYAAAIRRGGLTFGLGPAGTGKTYVAGCIAAEALLNHQVEKIILTRPAVEAGGERLGFLPGEKEEKFDPYFDPFRDVLEERLGRNFVELLIKDGRIKCEPFAYMRGKTFKNAFVILDEAQNATVEQFKLFLTRIGENATVVVDGDETQCDVDASGLLDAANRLLAIPAVKVVMFRKADIVRSAFVQEVVEALEAPAPGRLNPVLQR
jgi:phosphate starvation-inducible PhoH-like protein